MGLTVDMKQCRMETMLTIWSRDISIILTAVIATTTARSRKPEAAELPGLKYERTLQSITRSRVTVTGRRRNDAAAILVLLT